MKDTVSKMNAGISVISFFYVAKNTRRVFWDNFPVYTLYVGFFCSLKSLRDMNSFLKTFNSLNLLLPKISSQTLGGFIENKFNFLHFVFTLHTAHPCVVYSNFKFSISNCQRQNQLKDWVC